MARSNRGDTRPEFHIGMAVAFAAAVAGMVRSVFDSESRARAKFRYTEKQLAFIRKAYRSMTLSDVAVVFNKKFGTSVTAQKLNSACRNHGITCGRKVRDRLINRVRLFTEEQVRFLGKAYPGRSVGELTELFNARFGLGMTEQQIKSAVHNRGIVSGRTGRFEKGLVPWNKGVKGYMGPNVTSFKKGNAPANRKPLGSERISRDGFIEVKIAERNPYTGFPTRYRHKHVHIWEQLHGPVPEGHVVSFVDGNPGNCEPGNLMLITRAELLAMNLHNYKEAPGEIKPSILSLAKLEAKAGIRTKPGRKRGLARRRGGAEGR